MRRITAEPLPSFVCFPTRMFRPAVPAATCILLALFVAQDLRIYSVATTAPELEGFGEEEFPDTELNIQEGVKLNAEDAEAEKPVGPSTAELWDEDEFEGLAVDGVGLGGGAHARVGRDSSQHPRKPKAQAERRARRAFARQEHYYFEIAAAVCLVIYAINVFVGKSSNEAIALAWARAYVSEGGVLEKNFSLLGPGDLDDGEVLMKESQSQFKFYASGRRYCDGFLATLDLRARQDVLSMMSYLVAPRDDLLDVEVYMSEGCMPPIVVAFGVPKVMRVLSRECEDIKTYAKPVNVRHLSEWPSDRWTVMAESSEVFYDLVGEQFVEQIFGEAAYDAVGKYFRYLHFTSEMVGASHKNVLRFSFVLPPSKRMEEISKLMAMVPKFVDIVGTYRLSAEARKKAEKNRAEESERLFREGTQARRDALQQKKREQLEAERERIKKLSPEEQQKWSEKQQKLKQRRAQKMKMIRV